MGGAQWRRYLVFISSTFKDMDVERDIIKFRVVPALNRRFCNDHIQIQAIDLRLGINPADMTEEESERKVLDACLACIDSARPFFIGLLGERYGWIPPERSLQRFLTKISVPDRAWFQSFTGKSVTELEFMYGSNTKEGFCSSDSFFFFRDGRSYDVMDAESKKDYCDSENPDLKKEDQQERSIKLQQFKRSVRDIASKQNRNCCINYDLSWNESTHKFCDKDNAFFQKVYTVLADSFDQIAQRQSSQNQNWIDTELLDYQYAINRLCRSKQVRTNYLSQIQQAGNHVLLYGCAGCGKSTLLSQLHSLYEEHKDYLVLYASVASSEHMMSVQQITLFWIECLWRKLKIETNDSIFQPSRDSAPAVYEYFQTLCCKARSLGLQVVCLLDNMESLCDSPVQGAYIPWLNPNIIFRGCTHDDSVDYYLSDNSSLCPIEIGPLGKDEVVQFTSNYQKEFVFELPDEIRCRLPENITPLYLRSLFITLSSLSAEDFRSIRDSGNASKNLNRYLVAIFEHIPNLSESILTFLIDYLSRQMRLSSCLRKAIAFVIAAPDGLRESDLEALFAKEWNPLDFYVLIDKINDFIDEDLSMHNFRVRDPGLRKMIIGQLDHSMWSRLADLHSDLPKEDPKYSHTLYYILRSKRNDLLQEWLDFDKSCFDSNELSQTAFRFATVHLISENNFEEILQELVVNLLPPERVRLLVRLFLFGCKYYIYISPSVAETICSELLDTNLSLLDSYLCYDIASVYKEMSLVYHYSNPNEERMFFYTKKAISAYRNCYNKNANCKDVKNMLIAMLSQQIPSCAENGDDEEVLSLLAEIQTLTGVMY